VLEFRTFTVGATNLTRNLTLEWYDRNLEATLSLSILPVNTSGTFTDSPNNATCSSGCLPSGYGLIRSATESYATLTLNGVVDLRTSVTSNPRLNYRRYYDLTTNNSFRVQYSVDGGFTWLTFDASPTYEANENLTGNVSRLPPNDWDARSIDLNNAAFRVQNFTIRFLLDTRANDLGTNDDGAWVSDIYFTG
jgi:hypothetical protein